LGEKEIDEVLATLRSGWLTTGPRVRQFEEQFAAAVRGRHAVAVNSCTAALHLALEALNVRPGQGVLVPTMTFAATAEVVRYMGAIPILVDCDPETANMDLEDAKEKICRLRKGQLPEQIPARTEVVGVIPVHVGGMMMNLAAIQDLADAHRLWVVEDAAHSFPAAWRRDSGSEWELCGQNTSAVTCYSFYANKTITTGEGGMAVTSDPKLAERMRLMSLHGLSHDAWGRYSGGRNWDYKIIAPGYKYNLTDIAAAIGIHQLAKAEEMRVQREAIALEYIQAFREVKEIALPPIDQNRIHSWHLFPIRLQLDQLEISRNEFMERLKHEGVGCSVHWRPLHLHPYYIEEFGWEPADLPVATAIWEQLISLPIFPGMARGDVKYVIDVVKGLCATVSKGTEVLVA
jgi:perosamine synthetase